ncbi:unnamed protein product [Jaminaea pallidilutea]
MAAAKQQKGELYAKELDRTRLRGSWDDGHLNLPSKAKNNTWGELVRKYNKHNPNSTAISAIASVEQQLRSSLDAYWREQGYTDASHEQDNASPGTGSTLLPPSLPAGRQGKGWSTPRFEELTAQLEELERKLGNDESAIQGATAIQAYMLLVLGKAEEAVSFLHESHFLQTVNTDQLRPEEQSDQYQTALFLLGFVTYGIANEHLHTQKPKAGYGPFAFAGYARAIELHEQVRGGKRASALPGLPEDEIERWAETALYRNALLSVREGDASLGFNALRAYQAHVSRWPGDFRLPQRNVINRTFLRALNVAAETGSYVPLPALPPKSQDDWRSQAYQRSVVAAVAARIKIRDFESERAPRHTHLKRTDDDSPPSRRPITSRTVSKRRPHLHRTMHAPPVSWSNEVQTIANTAAQTVQRSSEFPRAGRVNLAALNLADELIKSWKLNGEQGGEQADDLIESLYTLTRLSFHSQRISRYLFQLLSAAQAYHEAHEALELYVSIVEKAREGDAAGSASLVEESKRREKQQEEEGYDLEKIKEQEKEEEDKPPEEKEKKEPRGEGDAISGEARQAGEKVLVDIDDDATFVNTLLNGAYMLVRYLDEPEAADKMAKRALKLVPYQETAHQNKSPWKPADEHEYVARTLRIAGTARAAWAMRQPDATRVPKLQNEALSLLRDAVDLDPESSEAHYQLALMQAQMREVSSAILTVRRAIELEPADVRSWHLLTLLVSAQKDPKAAFQLAEVALEEAEEDDENDRRQRQQSLVPNGEEVNGDYLGQTTELRTRLLSVDYPPTAAERAEAVLQLMMTQNALEEIVAGAEVAIESQKESFQFFHDYLSVTVAPSIARLAPSGGGTDGTGNASGVAGGRRRGLTETSNSSGLGLSGSALFRPQTVQRSRNGEISNGGPAGDGNADGSMGKSSGLPTVSANVGDSAGEATAAYTASTGSSGGFSRPAEARRVHQLAKEMHLLGTLWLTSAATFRRAGNIEDARSAVQEAERVDPGRAEVWVQLALLTEPDDTRMAINSLYKALACEAENVAGSVHLARIFLEKDNLHLVAGGEGFVNGVALPPASDLPQAQAGYKNVDNDGTRSRSIGADPKSGDMAVGGTRSAFASTAEAQTSQASMDLTALSLAEGLLVATTNSLGWDSAEAWLFLGRVCMQTGRRTRARECLKWALELEGTKSVRPLGVALGRS